MTSFSSNLERLMNKRDMSDSDLANLVDVNRTTVTRWRKGIRSPKLDKLPEIANVFGVEPLDLINDSNNLDTVDKITDVSVSLYQDIIENLDDLKENNAPLVNDFIEEIIKEQNNKSTLIPETTRIQTRLSYSRQHNVLDYAKHQLELQNNTKDNIVDFNDYKDNKVNEASVYGYVSAGTGEQIFDEPQFKVAVKGDVPIHDLALQVNGNSMEPMFHDKEVIFIEKTHEIKNGQIGVFIIDGEAYVKKVYVEENRLTLVSLNKEYPDLHFYENQSVELVGKVIL
ncbi:helix-turn-helix domain-containing protein [Staphylococcus simulans]|uniref:helix-turn-helix domain-containing protein n=1 Tax=Staphylococcus simulans TaxID=1286 RepID=UPI001F4253CA|nr:XRE family transcriptional regulator [Staphylococcus simulans]